MKLLARDMEMFSQLGIGPELLQRARIERVDDAEARSRFGLTGSRTMDLSGIAFPYFDPLTDRRHTARVRRDRPEIENGQPKKKYICPYGDRRHLYLLPGAGKLVKDSSVPLVLVEAEKGVLALTAWAERVQRQILVAGLGGCWGWRGRIGKRETAYGDRVDEVGPLPELMTICSPGRKVVILLDSNARTNAAVQAARGALARTIAKQNSVVYIADLPGGDGINGPDDLVGARGDAALARVLDSAKPFTGAEPDKYSDDALASAFSDRHAGLRYTAAWGRWHIWRDDVWEDDTTLHVYDMARELCREISVNVEKSPALARSLTDASTISAVERLARADRRHAAVIGQWDADPWMLNTPGGIVDLRSHQIKPARATDYCRKVTAVAPAGESVAPVWLSFLNRVTGGDSELQSFLRRVAGYCLTGFTREDVLFFAFGPGRNGKTVFLNALAGIWADYAKNAPTEMFLVQKGERHPTDLARLQGARLVTAAELESGKRWAESRIKSLTGGDPICARFMRGDFFEYSPQFKLIFAANHKPSLKVVDEAIRSRFLLLPFTVTIPPDERDKSLPEKLRAEWPAILRWAIDGCLAWQREGLNPPPIVIKATQEYFASEDTLARWLDEKCLLGPQYETSSSALFRCFREWAENAGEMASSQRAFSQNLLNRGFVNHHTRSGWFFKEIALKNDARREPM
jgi:P4 family phage/plasmid primase-like protien